jgi:protein TonB
MQTFSLAFSVVVHLLVVVVVVITPIVANGDLPAPRRAFDHIVVRPVDPPPPPPPAPGARRETRRAAVGPEAAPTVAPDRITKETGIEHFESPIDSADAGATGGIPGGGGGAVLAEDPTPPPLPAPAPPVRVGGSIHPPQKLRHVAPVYPELARAARREGIVILEAVIGEDGRVRSLRVLRSVPLLDQAALDAVRQWQFTPTLLNGEPVPVVMTVTVGFVLKQ